MSSRFQGTRDPVGGPEAGQATFGPGPAAHLSLRQLTAFARAALPEAEAAEVRRHLQSCPTCRELAADAESFGLAIDPEHAEEWRERRPATWDRLEARLPREEAGLSAVEATPPSSRAPAGGRRWLAVAALLALASGLAGSWVGSRLGHPDRESPRPEPLLSVPSFDLFPASYRRGGGPRILVLDTPWVLLDLHADDPGSFEGYRLLVTEARRGRVWEGEGLRPTVAGSFRIALPRELLVPGAYRLEVEGLENEGLPGRRAVPVALYELVVAEPP